MADKNDGRAVGAKVVLPAFLAMVLLFMGTALIARGFCLLTHPVYLEDTYWTGIDDGDVVFVSDLTLVDPFLSVTGPAGKTVCCLASFADASGDMCIGVLRISEDEDLYQFLNRYTEDGNAPLGSYALRNVYCSIVPTDDFGEKFSAAYADSYNSYADALAKLSSDAYNGSVRQTTLCFSYLCDGNENYLAAQGLQDTAAGVIGIVIAAVGAAGVVFCAVAVLSERKRSRQ